MDRKIEKDIEDEVPPEGSDRRGKKSRFKISQEAQENFVNEIAEMIVKLGQDGEKWHPGWKQAQTMFPYCAATGRPYSGNNILMLMLKAMAKDYDDPRWLTFNQMDAIRKGDSERLKDMHVRKGEKAVTILRPEPAYFLIDPETKKWKFLKTEEVAEIRNQEAALGVDAEASKIHSTLLYYPFKVFNVEQIENFPREERDAEPPTEIERNDLIERFVASSGVQVKHAGHQPCFKVEANEVVLPLPQDFESSSEYYATKMHEFFHATGHESRENRLECKGTTITVGREYAFEEIRAEIFSMLAGAHLGLPTTDANSAAYIGFWNGKFSGGDAKAVFKAAKDASKILTLLAQFENGEQPSAKWFPKLEDWPSLVDAQKKRDVTSGVLFQVEQTDTEENDGPCP